MPLIKYTRYISYPTGNPAANTPVAVWLLGGNVLVPLFADKAGTIPLANPVTTDQDGLVSVYAAPGPLTVELAGQVFALLVDAGETDDAWPGVFVHEQDTPASVWTVEHHFGVEPTVDSLVSSLSTAAEVSHPDTETTVITFAAPTSGVAHLRR